jgi:orotidine-5'-phosphate decarboxylase
MAEHDSGTAATTPSPETGASAEVRSRLALALDTDDAVEAIRLARELAPWFGVTKVGLELFTAAGPDVVARLADSGFDVFVDLKMFDIPTTVERAARVVGSLGARYLTLHARDDAPMLRAGAEGFSDGAERAGLPAPVALAVTVLTSDGGAPAHILPRRVALAAETGCGGIVCAASDVAEARRIAPRLVRVVPGIRAVGGDAHDQARSSTPQAAFDAGADLLVIGRAVTAAPDRAAAAAALVGQLGGTARPSSHDLDGR